MKKTGVKKRSIMKSLMFGAVIGGILGVLIPLFYDLYTYNHLDKYIDTTWLFIIITLFLTVLLTIISKLLFFKVQKSINQDIKNNSELEEIEYKKLLRLFYQAQLFGSSAIIINALFLSASYLILDSNRTVELVTLVVIGILFIIVNTRNVYLLLEDSKYFYNIDESYDWADKRTMYDLIDHIDDGERLMMLQSLYRSYEKMILLSMGSMIVLSFYQVISKNNQILAMCCFTVMLIYSTYSYYKHLKKYIN